jgi:hypothetical protein
MISRKLFIHVSSIPEILLFFLREWFDYKYLIRFSQPLLQFEFQKFVAAYEPALHMLAGVFGCPASPAFFFYLELKAAFIAIVNLAFFHVCAVDHSNLLNSSLVIDYIQRGSIIK